jgi:hypothetical protein
MEMVKNEAPTGVLFSAGFPVFKNANANTHLQEQGDELNENEENPNAVDTATIERQFPNENSLSLFNVALTNT